LSLRLGSRHQGRIACASDRGDGLGAGARTLAAFCRDAVQRRRLGDDGSGRSQCDRRAVVRVRKRPTALTAAYNGSSIGGVVFSPLWVAAIGLLGFPWAAIAIGLVVVATIWTLARPLLLQNAGNDGALSRWRCNVATILPASSAKPLPKTQVWKDWRLVTLAACMALSLFAQIGLLAHLFSLQR